MAFGFSPKHLHEEYIEGLSTNQILALAVESIKALEWKLSYLSPTGLIAYTSNSIFESNHEITIKIQDNKIFFKSTSLGSELFDLGKNKKNSTRFYSKFKYLHEKTSLEQLNSIWNELSSTFENKEEDLLNLPPKTSKEKITDIFSIFIPKEGYFITPILLNLNLIIFIIMQINGAGLIVPDNQVLIDWGANFRPLTLDGSQWWRLFTSTFLHAGILHLVMNMYALLYIGLLLEPYIGKARFAFFYILTGLFASLTSLYWHDFTVSVGASGAIFGMYGIFLAMLTTNLIEKTARKAFLTSIAVFVVYNLLAGMKGNIDNAAHIGGLISGILLGYGAYFSLKEQDEFEKDMKNIKNLAFSSIVSILIIAIAYNSMNRYYNLLDNRMKNFGRIEVNALAIYRLPDGVDSVTMNKVINDGLTQWDKCDLILDSISKMDLPIHLIARNSKLKDYVKLRKEAYLIIKEGINRDSIDMVKLQSKNQEIEMSLNALKNNN